MRPGKQISKYMTMHLKSLMARLYHPNLAFHLWKNSKTVVWKLECWDGAATDLRCFLIQVSWGARAGLGGRGGGLWLICVSFWGGLICVSNSVNCRRFNCIKLGNVSLRRGAGHLHAIFHAISSWSIFCYNRKFQFCKNLVWSWQKVLFCQVQNHDLKSFSEFVLLIKTYKWTANVLIQNWFCELIWECKDSALNCPGTRVR